MFVFYMYKIFIVFLEEFGYVLSKGFLVSDLVIEGWSVKWKVNVIVNGYYLFIKYFGEVIIYLNSSLGDFTVKC